MNISTDTIYNGRISFIQPLKGYRIAIDPLLLAATTQPKHNEKWCEFGAGTGAISLATCFRNQDCDFSLLAIEKDPSLFDLFIQNIKNNHFEDKIQPQNVNIEELTKLYAVNYFDHIIMNPPYYEHGKISDIENKQSANHTPLQDLETWLHTAFALLKHKGYVSLIFDQKRLHELLKIIFMREWGDITCLPLHPKQGREAHRVIIRLRKGVKSPMRFLPGIVLHHEDDRFTEFVYHVINEGQTIKVG